MSIITSPLGTRVPKKGFWLGRIQLRPEVRRWQVRIIRLGIGKGIRLAKMLNPKKGPASNKLYVKAWLHLALTCGFCHLSRWSNQYLIETVDVDSMASSCSTSTRKSNLSCLSTELDCAGASIYLSVDQGQWRSCSHGELSSKGRTMRRSTAF